ncbi:triphosphoribosyl-dephospho-CoA synthase [Nocardia jiangxiensis]|uniref:triphosphoribosyl-dephospho-CoA synthase n=1 Tax=Nocardia jiangxiensis TaxID=282685 RepID=A0ABW6SC13_9NOCA
MLATTGITGQSARSTEWSALSPRRLADLAVGALRAEAELTPKPGLVDRRGGGTHRDMDLDLLLVSAEALRDTFEQCATAAIQLPLGPQLRARLGVIGQEGEARMLAATGGVNTHRGALWALGLLSAATVRHCDATSATRFAANLARLPDRGLPMAMVDSHGQRMCRRYGVAGAKGEAAEGFPHVTRYALPALHRARALGACEVTAQLDALLAVMAHLDDTCLLHRGGPAGLAAVRAGARVVVSAGGCASRAGHAALVELDRLARVRRLSAGGSADVLSAALFLDSLTGSRLPHRPGGLGCRP